MTGSGGVGLEVVVPSTGWGSAVVGSGDNIRSLRARAVEQEAVVENLRKESASAMVSLERVAALVQPHIRSALGVGNEEVDGGQPRGARKQEGGIPRGGNGARDPWAEFYRTAFVESLGNHEFLNGGHRTLLLNRCIECRARIRSRGRSVQRSILVPGKLAGRSEFGFEFKCCKQHHRW